VKPSAYPSYKSSGVDWLGDIPQDWDVKRLKFSATINDEALAETTPPDFEFEYVDISSVNSVDGITTTEHLAFDTAPSRARRRVRHGDTIVSTVRTYLRAIAPIKHPPQHLIVSTGFAVVRPRNIDPPFMAYALRESAFVESVVSRSVGVSYPAVNASELGDISIPIPGLAEQQAIAHFLDHETGRIDRLVAKKWELIERLKEKRIALISRVVARGLPPSAASAAGIDPHPGMKASGVEWLGDIPEHWEVKRLKFELVKIEQGWSPQCDSAPAGEGEWGVLKAGAVNGSEFDPRENKRLPEDETPLRALEIKTGDFLISRANTRELVGSAALVGQVQPQLLLCDKLYRLTFRNDEISEFVLRFMRSKPGHYEFERDASGSSASMQNIGQQSVLNLWIALPPPPEQSAINAYLDHETAKLDALNAKIGLAVERLLEYRTALITAAVTGKIDVRKAAA
jgi:type I restriction enzyme S subunit